MKKIMILVVILITISSLCLGQRTPLLPHNDSTGYSKEEIKNLALGTSKKSIAFKNYLVEKLSNLLKDTLIFTEENIPWAFDYFVSEEVTLKTGEYNNSGWSSLSGEIEFFPGKDLTAFVWRFRLGTYEITICKGNCANPLNVFAEGKKVVPKQQPQQTTNNGNSNGNSNGNNNGNGYSYDCQSKPQAKGTILHRDVYVFESCSRQTGWFRHY